MKMHENRDQKGCYVCILNKIKLGPKTRIAQGIIKFGYFKDNFAPNSFSQSNKINRLESANSISCKL